MHEPNEIDRLYRELVHSVGREEEHQPVNYGMRDERPLRDLVDEVRRLAATNPLAEGSVSEQHAPALAKTGEQNHSIERAAAHLQPSNTQDLHGIGLIERVETFVGPEGDGPPPGRRSQIRPLWWAMVFVFLVLILAGGAILFVRPGTADKTKDATNPVPSATKGSASPEIVATPGAPGRTPNSPIPVPIINPETAADTVSAPPDSVRASQQDVEPPAAAEKPRPLEASGGITAPAGVTGAATAVSPPLKRSNVAKRSKRRRRAPAEVRPR